MYIGLTSIASFNHQWFSTNMMLVYSSVYSEYSQEEVDVAEFMVYDAVIEE